MRRHIVSIILCTVSIMLSGQNVPWTVPAISTNSSSLLINCIPFVDGQSLNEGDYIGVFSDPGQCFGLARWKDTADFRITVYGYDGVNDGFRTGENLNLRIWIHDENCVISHVGVIESDNPMVFSNTAAI